MLYQTIKRSRKAYINGITGMALSAKGAGKPGGAIPTTILEIYGEYWDGANMNAPYIGAPITVVGVNPQRIFQAVPFNRFVIQNVSSGSYMDFGAPYINPSPNNDNYVCFSVSKYATGVGTGLLTDYRNIGTGNYYLILESRNGGGDSFNGYAYSPTGTLGGWVDLAPNENNDVYEIRVWIFQAGRGDFYVGGGASIYNDLWTPTFLGGVGHRNRFHQITQVGQNCRVAHFSIHKFPAASLVSPAWVNVYGAALNVYYNNQVSWTDI